MRGRQPREIYLWQGILVFVLFISIFYYSGDYFKDKILYLFYTSSFFAEDYDSLSKIDKQMIDLEQKIRDNPNDPNDYLQLGWIYYKKGAPNEAIKVFTMALNIEPDYIGALYNLGLVYMEQKDYSKAAAFFKKILAKHPDHELAGLALIKNYYSDHKYREADILLTKLKPYYTTSADYFYYQGLITEKQGRQEEAVLAYKKAVSFDPEFKEAKVKLEALEN